MTRLNFHPGGCRDEYDSRDRRFAPALARLPRRVDLSRYCGPAYQQYRTQSCSANALASALVVLANQLDLAFALPSRLFIYYNARLLKGQQRKDSGTTIRTALKALVRYGAPPEAQWPFRKRRITLRPPRACYRDNELFPIVYHRVRQRLDHLHAVLAQAHAFVFGIEAYGEPFTQAATTAYLRLPRKTDTLFGGHALIAVGYDRDKQAFLARNSLGAGYAHDGFFWIPDAYFTNPKLTYDFWFIGGSTG